MNSSILGRTNAVFPRVWIRLSESKSNVVGQTESLAKRAAETGCVLDIGSNPAMWGGFLRGSEAPVMVCGGEYLQSAQSEEQASDFMQAHLLEILCSLGRPTIDFYFLNLPKSLEEFQIQAALETLEIAKQEGTVRFSGFHCSGEPYAALGHWQFNDAFEVALVPRNPGDQDAYSILGGLAQERRVGLIASRPLGSKSLLLEGSDAKSLDAQKQILEAYLSAHSCLISAQNNEQVDYLLDIQNNISAEYIADDAALARAFLEIN